MQINPIKAYNCSGCHQKPQVSFGVIDGCRTQRRELDVYEKDVYVPRGYDAVKVNILAHSPYEDEYVKTGEMYKEIDKSKF